MGGKRMNLSRAFRRKGSQVSVAASRPMIHESLKRKTGYGDEYAHTKRRNPYLLETFDWLYIAKRQLLVMAEMLKVYRMFLVAGASFGVPYFPEINIAKNALDKFRSTL
jgi:hypothetical protein